MNTKTLIAFPILQTICNKRGYSKPTVIKSIKRLEDAQIIPRIETSNALIHIFILNNSLLNF